MAKEGNIGLTNSPAFNRVKNALGPIVGRSRDVIIALGVLLIIGLLIIPVHSAMLDMMLALNLAFAVLILMVAVYLVSPLEFSSFPTILLIATLFRLGLNVASTRLILGEAYAGEIIGAFGSFVIKGNYVVGIIIFLILLIINYVVVIKGSTRIAEVAARFTLDALPGKQMSIDADLNAGYIDEQAAKERREALTQESDFYGAMDGAAKFIKGDAIAALVITLINIIGGFAVGMAQLEMDISTALSTYTILTIGDGLVSQIPSLLISVSAGMVVTRSAATSDLDDEITRQFTSKPRALIVAAVAMVLLAVLPGFPPTPFLLLALVTGFIAYSRSKAMKIKADEELKKEMAEAEKAEKPEEKPVEELLKVDPVEIELGYNLISLVDEAQGGDLFKRITNVRRQLAIELGIILPPVRVRDNLKLEPDEYVIKIRSNEAAKNALHPNMLLAMDPGTAEGDLEGINVTEPVFGLPATWINFAARENAEIKGYTVVESATVLTTHLTEILKDNADKLLTRQDVQKLVDNLKQDYPALVEEIKPDNLPIAVLQKVLQNLLKEGIPIKDMPLIVESLLEYYKTSQNPDVLTEYVRHNISETISKLYSDENGVIHAVALDPGVEETMTKALQSGSGEPPSLSLGLAPDTIKTIRENMSKAIDEITLAGRLPVVICSAQIRPYFYRLIRNQFPMVKVISYTELPPDADLEITGAVNLNLERAF